MHLVFTLLLNICRERAQAVSLYSDMDLNHDGQITLEEFKASVLMRVKA